MTTGNPSLVCRDVSKNFGDNIALSRVSFEVFDSQYLCIIGPSGAGKTTLLRIVAGLETPTDGQLILHGRKLNHIPVKERNVAMLFQDYALFPHLTAYDNIAVGLKIRHLRKPQIDEKVKDVASLLGIERLLRRKPRQLSGGERQRVAIARAIIREPDLFLLDEPLANLDAELRTIMKGELRALQRNLQKPFIHVTHDQAEALSMSDVVLLLDCGENVDLGSAEEVYSNPGNLRSAQFIGFPRINTVDAVINSTGNSAEFAVEGFSSMLHADLTGVDEIAAGTGREVTLGIRPESLALSPYDTYTELGRAEVVGREFFGIIVYLVALGKHELRVVDSRSPFHGIGDTVDVHINLRKTIFFDRATGRNLFPKRTNRGG